MHYKVLLLSVAVATLVNAAPVPPGQSVAPWRTRSKTVREEASRAEQEFNAFRAAAGSRDSNTYAVPHTMESMPRSLIRPGRPLPAVPSRSSDASGHLYAQATEPEEPIYGEYDPERPSTPSREGRPFLPSDDDDPYGLIFGPGVVATADEVAGYVSVVDDELADEAAGYIDVVGDDLEDLVLGPDTATPEDDEAGYVSVLGNVPSEYGDDDDPYGMIFGPGLASVQGQESGHVRAADRDAVEAYATMDPRLVAPEGGATHYYEPVYYESRRRPAPAPSTDQRLASLKKEMTSRLEGMYEPETLDFDFDD